MAIDVFVRGNQVIAQVSFRVPDEAGTLTDPETVTFTVRQQGTSTRTEYDQDAAEVTNPSVGVWELELEPGAGRWTVHCQGTGAAHAAAEGTFEIPDSGALAP